MKYAVVNTLKFGRHTDYENDERLMAVLMRSARKSPYFNAGMDRAYRL